jgi:hypothetical protein
VKENSYHLFHLLYQLLIIICDVINVRYLTFSTHCFWYGVIELEVAEKALAERSPAIVTIVPGYRKQRLIEMKATD